MERSMCVVRTLFFSPCSILLGISNVQLLWDHYQIVLIVICFIIFGAHMNMSFIIKVRSLCSLSGHISWTKCMLTTIEPRMVNIFRTCSPIFSKHMMSFVCPVLDAHLTTYHSSLDVWLSPLFNQETSTLIEWEYLFSWRFCLSQPLIHPCTWFTSVTFKLKTTNPLFWENSRWQKFSRCDEVWTGAGKLR